MTSQSPLEESSNRNNVLEEDSSRISGHRISRGGLMMGSKIRAWADISKINYLLPSREDVFDISSENIIKNLTEPMVKIPEYVPEIEELTPQRFPFYCTRLLSVYNDWGCFYNFPEYYGEEYSPVVHVKSVKDVPEQVGGILTPDLVAACLSYLRRIPLLKDYVYIKLDLSSQHLKNIEILQNYKFLVYLDLSSNFLTELTVLSYLPYLQYLTVNFNRLTTLLDYETPQWFLSEVHYEYNALKEIRDITAFWSITVLDLSHNNIKGISGLEQLRYLRRLDLSFNHIKRIKNLNHLRLVWLDLSYNNISSFEFSTDAGLWTLLHLEYLNLNENSLTTMKLFLNSTRLRELHARNNRFGDLLEVPLYMGKMGRLSVLDLRANPVCASLKYKQVVCSTLLALLSLDAEEIDPVELRNLRLEMTPNVFTFATRRLVRLLYIEQMSKGHLSPYVPSADTTDVPIIVLVGREAIGKGTLARRMVSEYSTHLELAKQHTTATEHFPEHYIAISRDKFDNMLLAGDFLTYSEMNLQSYGLSREEASVRDGKARIVTLDLVAALMLKHRGYRPYLILMTSNDKKIVVRRQQLRKILRDNHDRLVGHKKSTLQVMISGTILVTGILNEILMEIPEEKGSSQFLLEPDCSLLMDSDTRQAKKVDSWENDWLDVLTLTPMSSFEDLFHKRLPDINQMGTSMYSLYKESEESPSDFQNDSYQFSNKRLIESAKASQENNQSSMVSSTYKGGSKSSKSVTFTSQDENSDPSGLIVEPGISGSKPAEQTESGAKQKTSIIPSATNNSDTWIDFITETGRTRVSQCKHSSSVLSSCGQLTRQYYTKQEEKSLMDQMQYDEDPDFIGAQDKIEEYENIHRETPGLFWDTVCTDDTEKAFQKLYMIIKNIVESQKKLAPMFQIDFANSCDYSIVQDRIDSIRKQICPRQLFY